MDTSSSSLQGWAELAERARQERRLARAASTRRRRRTYADRLAREAAERSGQIPLGLEGDGAHHHHLDRGVS